MLVSAREKKLRRSLDSCRVRRQGKSVEPTALEGMGGGDET